MGTRDMADRVFDPPAVVQACLRCPKDECTNCVSRIPRGKLVREKGVRKPDEKKAND